MEIVGAGFRYDIDVGPGVAPCRGIVHGRLHFEFLNGVGVGSGNSRRINPGTLNVVDREAVHFKVIVSRCGPLTHDASAPGIRVLAAAASANLGRVVDLLSDTWVQANNLREVTRNQGQVFEHLGIRHAPQFTRLGLQLHAASGNGYRFRHRARLHSYVQYPCFGHGHLHVGRRG